MTREEAREMLKALNTMLRNPDGEPISDVCEAIDMAIDDIERWRTWSHTYDNLIRREDAIEALDMLPSADAEDRLYIKIYADDEPSVKAEKLYQICGETQNRDVAEWLKEYFPTADAVQGEWVECLAYNPDLDEDVLYIECDQCGHRPYFSGSYRPKYCEDCGARMKGADDE